MLEPKEHEYEKVVLIGLITKIQDEEKSKEYLDELEFLAYTAGGEVLKRFTQKIVFHTKNVTCGGDAAHS